MDQERLDKYRARLLKEKARLQLELQHIHAENASVAGSEAAGVGGDQNYEDHMGDAATDMFDRERDLSLEMNIEDIAAQVEAALRRMDEGTYGMCTACGRPIDELRLKAIPYTDLCLADKERAEGAH